MSVQCFAQGLFECQVIIKSFCELEVTPDSLFMIESMLSHNHHLFAFCEKNTE